MDTFKEKDHIVRAVKAIKKVNNGVDFKATFIMFDKFKEYFALVKKHSIKILDSFRDTEKIEYKVEDKFCEKMSQHHFLYNDLLA